MATDYGTDILLRPGDDGQLDVDPTFPTVSGPAALAQSLVLRFSSPPGSCFWAPDDGMDLRSRLNDAFSAQDAFDLEAAARAEAEKEERIAAARATVTFTRATKTLSLRLRLEADGGPFELVLSADAAAVKLVSFRKV